MPPSRLVLSLLSLVLSVSLAAQQRTSPSPPLPPGIPPFAPITSKPVQVTPTAPSVSDPEAMKVVQAAITALGGAAAVAPLQTWTLQGQAEGRLQNGTFTQTLGTNTPQASADLRAARVSLAPARPRSLLAPVLVGMILLKQSGDMAFTVTKASAADSTVVVFSVAAKSGAAIPAQIWYFDNTTNLPTRIDFRLPAKVGPVEAFPGTVLLSNYQPVDGGVYPFRIVIFLQQDHARQEITLKSITASTTAADGNPPARGAQ